MNEHGFPDDMPIEEILNTYYLIDMKNDQSLEVVLAMLATIYVKMRSNLQPTYAAFSAIFLKRKFDYLVERVIMKNNEDLKEKSTFYYNFVSALNTYREREDIVKNENEQRLKQRIAEEEALELAISLEEKKEEIVVDKKIEDVFLYKFQEDGVTVNSIAFFDEYNLFVDYWRFTERYEQESIINVRLENCMILYEILEVEVGNKQDLLYAIEKKFNGKNCFIDFQEFLKQNNIEYGLRNK
jgi:hypothetical protein